MINIYLDITNYINRGDILRQEYKSSVGMLTLLYIILSVLFGYFSLIFILITTVFYIIILLIYTGLTITKCVDLIIKSESEKH